MSCWSSWQRSRPTRGDDSSLIRADFIRNVMIIQTTPSCFSGRCKVTGWQCCSQRHTFNLCLVSEQETSANHNVDITFLRLFHIKSLGKCIFIVKEHQEFSIKCSFCEFCPDTVWKPPEEEKLWCHTCEVRVPTCYWLAERRRSEGLLLVHN